MFAIHLASPTQREMEGGGIFACPGSQRTPPDALADVHAQLDLLLEQTR